MPNQPRADIAPHVGDVVRIVKRGSSSLLEVTYVDDVMVDGLVPYASTYTPGGTYEGSYRGRKVAWRSEVVSVERNAHA